MRVYVRVYIKEWERHSCCLSHQVAPAHKGRFSLFLTDVRENPPRTTCSPMRGSAAGLLIDVPSTPRTFARRWNFKQRGRVSLYSLYQ